MGSLTQGKIQNIPESTASTTDVPQWLQDYNQDLFSKAQAVAQLPYQPYAAPRVAQAGKDTKASYDLARNNVGSYAPTLNQATQATSGALSAPGGSGVAQPYFAQANQINPMNISQPYVNQAQQGINTASNTNTADVLRGTFNNLLPQSGLSAAQPYLNQASAPSYSNVQDYLNPYIQSVNDAIAKQGQRNLSENILPAISDQFIQAGGFGGSRMGEFGERAARDTQEAILNQQAQNLHQGYNTALGASQTDAGRAAGLASTAGNLQQGQQQFGLSGANAISGAQGADAARQLSAAGQTANLGQQQGAFGSQYAAQLQDTGTALGGLTQGDLSRQLAGGQQLGGLAELQQNLAGNDANALNAIGGQQSGLQQAALDVAYQDFLNQQQYPQQQVGFLSNVVHGLPAFSVPSTFSSSSTKGAIAPSTLSNILSGAASGASLYNSFAG